MEDLYVWALRIAHIFGGAFWVGAAIAFFAFIKPTAKALAPGSQAFMAELNVRRRFPLFILGSGVVTIVAGALLYWRASGGLNAAWIGSPTGLGFTIGAAAAVIALVIGLFVISPGFGRLAAIGREIAAGGGPPTPEQRAALAAADRRVTIAGTANVVLLTTAVVLMAVARYLPSAG